MSKKIVIFFGKERDLPDPFSEFGNKRKVYYDLFEIGHKRGLKMYMANGRDCYIDDLSFRNLLKYENGQFTVDNEVVEADAIYDRSGGLAFPPDEISSKVLNTIKFKKFCYDKFLMYDLLKDFMPKTFKISNPDDMNQIIQKEKLSLEKTYVIKPTSMFGGKEISIDILNNLSNYDFDPEKEYVLQEFIDTSSGIENLVEGIHDLRVVIVNKEIIWTTIRQPAQNSLLANVAQGGSIKQIEVSDLPEKIMGETRKIMSAVENAFGNQIYSIDFGIQNGVPYVFELNDQIGFPTDEMDATKFLNNIIDTLILLSDK